MTTLTKLHVQIGQVKVAGPGQILSAILGSCIGLALLHPTRQVYGLAHCLLSNSGGTSHEISGRHVDQALRSLVSLMELTPQELRKVQAIVTGGANMTMAPETDPTRLVGSINASSAYKAVRGLGIRNLHDDTGGILGRQINIDCTTGTFDIRQIPRLGGSHVSATK